MLYALLLLALPLQQPAQPFLRDPDIHGHRVVFTCEGDLWLGDIATGQTQRLTRSEGRESAGRFSPDGRSIAFTAEYDGIREVYVMDADGGVPRRITFTNEMALLLDWTPDGKSVLYRTSNQPAWYGLYTVPVAGGFPQRFPLEFGQHVGFAPDGNRFAFTRFARAGAAWYRYEGGQKNDIWVGDLAAKKFRKVYESRFSNEYPAWVGDRICFVHDEGARFAILSVASTGGSAQKLTELSDVELRGLQTDGRRLVYERAAGLEVLDPTSRQTMRPQFRLSSELMHMLPYLSPADRNVFSAHIGPTGKRVLVESRGQILSLPAKEGDVRTVLAKDGVRYRLPTFSPDGKKIAYVSDETREQQLYVANADGSEPKQLTTDGGRQLVRIQWSPDGKRIALSDNLTRLQLIDVENGNTVEVARGTGWEGPHCSFSPDSRWLVYDDVDRMTYFSWPVLYEIATANKTALGPRMTTDYQAVFSSDGKWLAFFSRRSFSPEWDSVQGHMNAKKVLRVCLVPLNKDVKNPLLPESDEETAVTPETKKDEEKKDEPPHTTVDLDGIADRWIELPIAADDYSDLAVVGERVLVQKDDTLYYYHLKDKKWGTLTTGVGSFQVSADNKKLLIVRGANLRVIDVSATEAKSDEGRVSFANYQLRINPRAEWENMYWDAWRLARDYFYVANMHGNDWPAVGEKYAKLLPSVRSRDELNEVIRFLYSELSISHIGVWGGDTRGTFRGASPAFLGIDVEPDASGYYKITRVLRGDGFSEGDRSPLAAPGVNVREGQYLLEVAGVPARVGSDVFGALIGRAGQVVAVRVNDTPDAEGARTVYVKPMGSEWRLRYYDWVARQREYVTKASEGKIGYIHIPDMGGWGMAEFLKQYYPQRNKEALLVDVRFNGGGNVSTNIIRILNEKLVAYFNSRNNPQPWTRQGSYFPGPMCCLINEFSGSNGEEFPHHFKALGLGPLVGRRTWGGEVGSDPGWPLADGGTVAIPNYGAWTMDDGWIIESRGVSPDYDVESDPNAWVLGKDPQLDKAVELMLAALKKNPVRRPVTPPDPVRVGPH